MAPPIRGQMGFGMGMLRAWVGRDVVGLGVTGLWVRTGCDGRNGAKCAATPMGPIPGPPPPCGIQNVLCKLR